MVLWGIMSASTSLCTNATTLIVLRFGLGLAESGFYPGALTLTLTLTLTRTLTRTRTLTPNPEQARCSS